MADIEILVEGPKWEAYHWFTLYNLAYWIFVPAAKLAAYRKISDEISLAQSQIFFDADWYKNVFLYGIPFVYMFTTWLAVYTLIQLFWTNVIFEWGLWYWGTWAMIGMVFFNWVGSYADDAAISYIAYYEKAKIYREGVLRYMTAEDFYGEFFIYTFNVAFKTVMNVAGWVITGMFYGDFMAHCDYMENYLKANEEEVLDAEYLKCERLLQTKPGDIEYCDQIRVDWALKEEAAREREEQEARDSAALDEEFDEDFDPDYDTAQGNIDMDARETR